jgi:hypothetical protein
VSSQTIFSYIFSRLSQIDSYFVYHYMKCSFTFKVGRGSKLIHTLYTRPDILDYTSERKQLSHLLLNKFITGIKKSSNKYKIKDTYTDVLLCVTGSSNDVKISELSDEDFAEV